MATGPRRSVPRSQFSERARRIHERRAQQGRIDQVVRRSAHLQSQSRQGEGVFPTIAPRPRTISFSPDLSSRSHGDQQVLELGQGLEQITLQGRRQVPVPDRARVAARDPEAGVANPPPPYTPRAPPLFTPASLKKWRDSLWAAYKRYFVEGQLQLLGSSGPDLGNLEDYPHELSGSAQILPRGSRFKSMVFSVRLFACSKEGPPLTPDTIVSFIEARDLVVLMDWKSSGRGSARQPYLTRLAGAKPVVAMKRGALETYFKAAVPKRPKYEASIEKSSHASYPFAIPHLPIPFVNALGFAPEQEGKLPYIPASIAPGVFEFLRQELPFYRVQYNINRGGIQTQINTPRFTTVFGVDETSRFTPGGDLVDAKTGKKVEANRYRYKPRPMPQCLDTLRIITEGTTGETFNFVLVNYYADGKDSISYHSDDEFFLGVEPAIASFSLGAKRDFLMKHKPIPPQAGEETPEPKPIKLPLGSGDMILMRGRTQTNWLHSIPKRAGTDASKGRINITFRKAIVKGGTDNYYKYGVGSGKAYRWDAAQQKMVEWEKPAEASSSGTSQIVASGSGQASGQ